MNQIHASAVVGPDVIIGSGNVVGPGAVLLGPLKLGDNNWIGPGAIIGSPPQVRGAAHVIPWSETSNSLGIEIGSNNVIREFVTIQQPSRAQTVIGNDCYLMTQSHIPHDARIGSRVTLANSVQLAGHCILFDDVSIGLSASVHQFTVIGQGAFIGMGSVVTSHIPPYSLAFGVPCRIRGANKIGMSRTHYSPEDIEMVETFLHSGVTLVASDFENAIDPRVVTSFDSWILETSRIPG
jgi:UDP-N-acetylglucosamine acyltransferase